MLRQILALPSFACQLQADYSGEAQSLDDMGIMQGGQHLVLEAGELRRPSVTRARYVHLYPLLDTAVMGAHHVNPVT